MRIRKGWVITAIVLFVVLGLGMHVASRVLKGQIESTLGEDASVGDIALGLFSVTISDLRIKAPSGWPVTENLYARRIVVAPDWLALLSRKIAVRYIHAEEVHQAILRDGSGRIRVLPSLLENNKKKDDAPDPEVTIGEIRLSKASLDFYDATIRKPPYRVQLEDVEATLGKVHLPDLSGRSPLELTGKIKGPHGGGSYSLKGDIALASRDSDLLTTMRDVDLTTLQPYLVRAADTGVQRGVLDLDLKSTVQKRHLNANGVLVLHDLVLSDSGGFMGLPRQATVNMLKNERKDISVKFSMQGNLDDPKFSINESLATKFSAGLAETLGISISGLGKSVGNAATGIGSALKGLFGH
jgi:hypothetical protein